MSRHPRPKKYIPKNINKYDGNPYDIISRSSWETRLMVVLDNNPSVISWSSESVVIPYLSPLDGQIHRYFVDFKVKLKQKNGSTKTLLIEVKPFSQTRKPEVPKTNHVRSKKRFLNEAAEYVKNEAKWKAAKEYAENRGWKFVVFTEKEIGLEKKRQKR